MQRRDLLKTVAASATIGGLPLAVGPGAGPAAAQSSGSSKPPNMLLIVVDELRFPSTFPRGISDVAGFLAKFMPNTYRLWESGVKFSSHFTAASACTPARGVLVTGLYSQQTWMLQTIKNTPSTKASVAPVLRREFPTYGKLLRGAGYQTPYIGKWHLSITQGTSNDLEAYGFNGLTYPDPTGSNLQGTVGDHANGYLNDQDIAAQAVNWLSARTPTETPWCLTVGFVNPHDQEFFWAGTEFQTYNNLFNVSGQALQPFTFYSMNQGTDYPPVVSWDQDPLQSPPANGYPTLPPNWESAAELQANKPSTQTFARLFQELVWGGVTDDPSQTGYGIQAYPNPPDYYGVGMAPYSYWQRTLDCYTQIMGIVDARIGEVVSALPADVVNDTIIILTSDHGDFAGAHGFAAGKAGTLYDEAFHVPLIVSDPTGRFTGDTATVRTGLTSSVDLLPLLVTLGNNGSRAWLTGRNEAIYGQRHDMLAMLQSASAPGRDYVLLATDELVPGYFVFNNAPLHLLGLRTADYKLGTYANWDPVTAAVRTDGLETEFYDYGTEAGIAETANTPDDPRAAPALDRLTNVLIPQELQAPLPGRLEVVQEAAKTRFLGFAALLRDLPPPTMTPPASVIPQGADF